MKIQHPVLVDLLQKAYSAEKAAAFAYEGHAGSLRDPTEKQEVKQIETDEWNHRREVLAIMRQHNIPISRRYERKYHAIGRTIGASCYVIGRFMPFFFAGRLESGNVCEYFRMMQCFHELGIRDHDKALYEMGIKEKEHEVYFLDKVRRHPFLPFFAKFFNWGPGEGFNDVNLDKKYPMEVSDEYCRR